MCFSAIKEIYEDYQRRINDRSANSSQVHRLTDGKLAKTAWRNLKVGQIVKIFRNEQLPADMVLISSSEPQGMAYLETANIDGESTLKIKIAPPNLPKTEDLHGSITCETPNDQIYNFAGLLHLPTRAPVSLDENCFMQRGAVLKNTKWAYAVIVYTGRETKILCTSHSTPLKRTKMERKTNSQIIVLICTMILLCALSTFGFLYSQRYEMGDHWYLMWKPVSGVALLVEVVKHFATFFLLYNTVVPVSLSVTLEAVRVILARLIDHDVELYDEQADMPAVARSSNLLEELGMVEYILTDKTGTLTKNDMILKHMIIGAKSYRNCTLQQSDLRKALAEVTNTHLDMFLFTLCTCHTVIVEEPEADYEYEEVLTDSASLCSTKSSIDSHNFPSYLASSPDELAIVKAAASLGHVFKSRTGSNMTIVINGTERNAEVLAIIEFTSDRKRMSTLIKTDKGKYYLFCKGADSVILPRLCPKNNSSEYINNSMSELEVYAREGLRTLCFAYRELSETQCNDWLSEWHDASSEATQHQVALDTAADKLECNLVLLGATGVEDKLQDGVQDTIACLLKANIRIWMLTGDRMETAVSTGFLSGLLQSKTIQLHLFEKNDLQEIASTLTSFKERIQNAKNDKEFALIVGGSVFSRIIEVKDKAQAKEIRALFIHVSSACCSVVCCRLGPLQKAQITTMIKDKMHKVTLAIGDGGNDVSMIQSANVGVGISGKEGLQASRSADFSIAQFRFLKRLLLVHGSWSVHRLSRVIQYCIFKNIVLYLGQFWYSFVNMYTGQTLYDGMMLINFSIIFTQAPLTIIGITDQFVQAPDLIENPQLYRFGQNERFVSKRRIVALFTNFM